MIQLGMLSSNHMEMTHVYRLDGTQRRCRACRRSAAANPFMRARSAKQFGVSPFARAAGYCAQAGLCEVYGYRDNPHAGGAFGRAGRGWWSRDMPWTTGNIIRDMFCIVLRFPSGDRRSGNQRRRCALPARRGRWSNLRRCSHRRQSGFRRR